MSTEKNVTQEEQAQAGHLYYHEDLRHLRLRIQLSERMRQHKEEFAILGLSSKETIRTGLRAVDASPFRTVFVVDEENGRVLFALSRNEEYVEAARKKKPKPPPPPPPPPPSPCCELCFARGGYACDALPDGDCICYGSTQTTGGITGDDTLDRLIE